MADHLDQAGRSENMRRIRSKGMKPEMMVRRLSHALGYRHRLHRKDLPGKPDLVYPGRKAVVFVHGCFWHAHDCRRGARTPKSNVEYWEAKRSRNAARDERNVAALEAEGWRVMTVWECETKDEARLAARLRTFLAVEDA